MRATFQWLTLGILLCSFGFPSAQAISPGTAGLLSVVPGLGQVAEGNTLEGVGWFTVIMGAIAFQHSIPITKNIAGTRTYFLSQAAYDLWHNIFAHSWIDILNESADARRGQISQVQWHIPFE